MREVAALMTGVILAGRIGAAHAAQLGTLQANEEIDALRVLGLDPMAQRVLPRLLDEVAAGASAIGAGGGAGDIGRTARDVQALVRPDAPLVQPLQATTTAPAADGRDLPGRGAQTLDRLTHAAEAVQRLGRTLERQPDALLRGRAGDGPWPAAVDGGAAR